MDWIDITQKAINFIELELGNSNLSIDLISRHIHVSESHFKRAFNILTGLTLSEYIRNRRLSIAGEAIKNTDKSILDISLDVGYQSPESFSKAFKRFHGISPSEGNAYPLKRFYPFQIKLILTQEQPLNFTIEEKPHIYLSGTTNIVPCDDSDATSYLWGQCEKSGYLEDCYYISGFENFVGVSTSEGYTIKAKCNEPSEKTTTVIPPHKWAIFKCEGATSEEILKIWDHIYSSWMTNTDYKVSNLPQLEVYYDYDDSYSCEIWIAII